MQDTCTSAVALSRRLCNDLGRSPAMQQSLCLTASAAGPAYLQCCRGCLRGGCTMQELSLRARGRTCITVTEKSIF